jgi:undecaprenyl diphosphate synthase
MPEISATTDFSLNIPADRLPAHIAFIMDGNGRWAKARGKNRIEGHLRGVKTVMDVVENSFRFGIRTITLYAFSTENQTRPEEEVSALMNLLKTFIGEYLPELLKNEVRLRVIGDLSWLPDNARSAVVDALNRTRDFGNRTLVVALNYSSRDEVLRAVSTYARAVSAGTETTDVPTWETFSRYLDTAEIPDPDLIVRTSGELRLSNFLLLQAAYSEFYFCDTLWPDFSKEDLKKAILDYASRERRFGKTGEQVRK